MATASKERSMPTISSNITSKLHRWVRRAATATTTKKTNSEQEDLKQTPKENIEIASNAGIPPIHGRSRSTPVELLQVQKPKRRMSTQSLKKDPSENTSKMRSVDGRDLDMTVHSGSFEDLSRFLLKSNLKGKCSQSTNSLLSDISWNGEVEELRKERLMRRTSSEDTQESCESYASSDFDFNGNESRRKPPTITTINKQAPAESTKRTILSKLVRSKKSIDESSRDIEGRLDRWVDKASRFSRRKQDSFESTSSIASFSSDGEYGSPVFYYDHQKPAAPKETRELVELQTALKELVTNCGTKVRSPQNDKKTVIRSEKRKLFRGRSHSLQEPCDYFVRNFENRGLKKSCNEINDQGVKRNVSDGNLVELGQSYNDNTKQHNSKGNLDSDCVDGITMNATGVNKFDRIATNVGHDLTGSPARQRKIDEEVKESNTEVMNARSRSSKFGNLLENEGEIAVGELADDDGAVLGNNSAHSSVTTTMNNLDKNMKLSKPAKSPKNYPAPSPPLSDSRLETELEKRELRESMRQCLDFSDSDLSAFAVECVRHANEKKKKEPEVPNAEEDTTTSGDKTNTKRASDSSNSLEGESKYAKWSSQSSILTNSSSEGKLSTDKLELSDEDFKLIRSTLQEESLNGNRVRLSSTESINDITSFEEGAILIELPTNQSSRSSPLDKELNGTDEAKESTCTENPGLRKFPSLPLFYVPKEEFDSDSIKRNKSLRRSLWEKIKKRSPSSLTRSTENLSTSNPTRSLSPPPRLLDPFYHANNAEVEEDLQPVSRPKAYSHSDTSKDSTPNSRAQIRPALETRRSVPLWKRSVKKNSKGIKEEQYGGYTPELVKPVGGVEELV